MSTGTISLYATGKQCEEFDEKPVSINVHRDFGSVYLSIAHDSKTPLVGLTITQEAAKALIADLQRVIDSQEIQS